MLCKFKPLTKMENIMAFRSCNSERTDVNGCTDRDILMKNINKDNNDDENDNDNNFDRNNRRILNTNNSYNNSSNNDNNDAQNNRQNDDDTMTSNNSVYDQ